MVVPSETVDCAMCKGKGAARLVFCTACSGKGKIQVARPARICPRCKGTGDTPHRDAVFFSSPHCPVCNGAGWALVI